MGSYGKNYGGTKVKAVQFMSGSNEKDSVFPFSFDAKALEDILTNEEIADLPIALYSIAGKFRTGKSFLLNLFILLLKSRTLNQPRLDLNDSSHGFQWQGGHTAFTDGLWIMNKPFILRKSNGTKIALFLMDTEGTDEPSKTNNATNAIFAMSTLLSSFQIFNIKNPFSEDELRKLHLFSSLGKHCAKATGHSKEPKEVVPEPKKDLVRSSWNVGDIEQSFNRQSGSGPRRTDAKKPKAISQTSYNDQSKTKVVPFQKLMFLIRDFPAEEIEDENGSFELGQKVLEEYLKEDHSQADDVRRIRRHIKKAFESIECYVLRNPGDKVSERSTKPKPLYVENVNQDFLRQVEDLSCYFFDEENIVVKKLNGQPVTCSQLYEHSQLILKVFKSGEFPKAVDIVEATDDSIMTKAREEGKKEYETQMNKKCGTNYQKEIFLEEFHEECKVAVMSTIEGVRCLGSEENRARHIAEFEKDIEQLWHIKKLENAMYKNEAINAIFKIAENVAKKHELKLGKETADTNPLSTADFSKLVDSKKEEALKSFKRKSSKYDDELLQQPMLNLDQKLQSINDSFILENMDKLEKLNLRLEQVENELIQEYETSMQKKCYQNPIEQSQFLKELEAEEAKALQEFEKHFNIDSDFLKQPALVQLKKKIREKQKHYEEINMFNLKQQQEDLKTIAFIEDHYKSSMHGNLQGTYTAPEKLDKFHEQSMNRAKKLAQQKLGATYSKHLNALSVAIRFHKTDFMNSNENFKKHAQIEFEKKKELCYEEYKSNMKKMLHKSEYYGNIESKHNQYKQIAVDEYRSIQGEPIREFNHIESKLKQKIDKQLKLFKHQNEIYKDEEDQQEKQVWDDAILRFELKIEKVMKENRRRRNKKVEKKYLEFVEDLLTGYRSNVADRFKYREPFLKEKLESIYHEKEEASLCTLL